MGYTTEFSGEIEIVPPLNEEEITYINKFSNTRRMHRTKGPYFVDGTDSYGQGRDEDILNYNSPDPSQPGLWCQWVISEDGSILEWNGAEKFYAADDWMIYLIEHFLGDEPQAKKLEPEKFSFLQGHSLNGTILAQGENKDDVWHLNVEENVVEVIELPSLYDFDKIARFSRSDTGLILEKIEQAINNNLEIIMKYEANDVIIYYSATKNSNDNVFDE